MKQTKTKDKIKEDKVDLNNLPEKRIWDNMIKVGVNLQDYFDLITEIKEEVRDKTRQQTVDEIFNEIEKMLRKHYPLIVLSTDFKELEELKKRFGGNAK